VLGRAEAQVLEDFRGRLVVRKSQLRQLIVTYQEEALIIPQKLRDGALSVLVIMF
jgi:hypothetical protein